MFLTKDYCYIDKNKTASVYVNKVLKQLNNGDYYFRHHEIPSLEIINSKEIIKFGTVRDPWEWYVSLWSYACKKQGMVGVYNNLTKFKPLSSYGRVDNVIEAFLCKQKDWLCLNLRVNTRRLFSDPRSVKNFREWLQIILDQRYAAVVDYPRFHSGLYKHSGLWTKQMLKFYFVNNHFERNRLTTSDDLNQLMKTCFIDDFISVDNIDLNLTKFFVKYGFHSGQEFTGASRSNVSSEKLQFYDNSTYDLVYENEKIMLDYLANVSGIDFVTKKKRFE